MTCELVRINGNLRIQAVKIPPNICISQSELKQYVENQFKGGFWEQINQLSGNPIFRQLLKEEAERYFKKK